MNYDYDVIIIGAGPIGSALAYQLASSNVKVALIDKKKKVGLPLQCAGIINRRILKIQDIPENLILNQAKGAHIHSKNHTIHVSKDETQALIIDRVAFDQHLFEKAKSAGADALLSSKVIDINPEDGIVLYNNSEGEKELKSKIIVGADGPKSLVYQKIGNEFKAYNASQYLVKVNGIDEMSFVDLYPKEELWPGFLWCIPAYRNIFRIGLYSNKDYKRQDEILDDFLENEFRYDDYEVLEKYKGLIPIHDDNKKLVKDRILLIGDAASQVKPTTGGGLLLGFQAVLIAAQTILEALEEDDLSILSNYQKEFNKKFSSEFSYQIKVQKSLSTFSDDDLDDMLETTELRKIDDLISSYGDMDDQSILVKELLKRGLILPLLPKLHKKELAKIWLLNV